jgi:hypothetical protein
MKERIEMFGKLIEGFRIRRVFQGKPVFRDPMKPIWIRVPVSRKCDSDMLEHCTNLLKM